MRLVLLFTAFLLPGCSTFGASVQGTDPPPDGWANTAPTQVVRVVDRSDTQLLEIEQGALRTWIVVPDVGADVGDHVLLGQGEARRDVEIPELGERAPAVVDIAHIQVVDAETARKTVRGSAPSEAVPIGTIYAELQGRADQAVVVHGTVVKASSAIGWNWVHLRDGTGDAASETHDLTVKTQASVREGQRVAFEGTLRKDVDLGFGYTYTALVEDGTLVP